MNPREQMVNGIGSIVINLLSLECLLRFFLRDTVGPSDPRLDLASMKAGDWVPEDRFTDYDNLRELINEVNRVLESRNGPERVDSKLVDLRDAIAHGRVLAQRPDGPYRLYKFSKPVGGRAQVTSVTDITPDWLMDQTQRVDSEIRKLLGVGQSLGLRSFTNQ